MNQKQLVDQITRRVVKSLKRSSLKFGRIRLRWREARPGKLWEGKGPGGEKATIKASGRRFTVAVQTSSHGNLHDLGMVDDLEEAKAYAEDELAVIVEEEEEEGGGW